MSDQIKNIILFAAIIFLCQCKDESKEPYSNEYIVTDNAQAALYFHVIFREAENVWAYIDSMDYAEGIYRVPESPSTNYKKLNCTDEEGKNIVIVEYHEWKTNHLSLAGKIKVIFSNDSSYRKNGMVANVYLEDFSINGQDVVGASTVKFTGAGEKDLYTFSLLNGSAIYQRGSSKSVLISGIINNGQYERIEGRETFSPDDDLWAYYGVMTGQLRNDPNLKYTNTVSATATYTVNGESRNGKVQYNMECMTALQGMSQIQIKGRPDIFFFYNCSEYYFESETHVF